MSDCYPHLGRGVAGGKLLLLALALLLHALLLFVDFPFLPLEKRLECHAGGVGTERGPLAVDQLLQRDLIFLVFCLFLVALEDIVCGTTVVVVEGGR